MREFTKIFKALSEPNRLRILKMLEKKPLCVCEITEALQLATSTVSKHLSILRDAGFIIDKKDGKWVNYTLQPENKAALLLSIISEWLESNETIIKDTEQLRTLDRANLCGI
jgi:ArsR family transcriptional regulator